MNKKKILTICNHGQNRSGCMAWTLKEMGHETITAGVHKHSKESIEYFTNWADKVIIFCEDKNDVEYLKNIIPENKFIYHDIGADSWGHPYNLELKSIMLNLISKYEWLNK